MLESSGNSKRSWLARGAAIEGRIAKTRKGESAKKKLGKAGGVIAEGRKFGSTGGRSEAAGITSDGRERTLGCQGGPP
jgi:hypothetical protein